MITENAMFELAYEQSEWGISVVNAQGDELALLKTMKEAQAFVAGYQAAQGQAESGEPKGGR